jgi:hypothetical protein
MRHTGNFNLEWGYLAPAPSFLRCARLVVVAATIAATASAGVVFALVRQPAAEASVAARTLVQPVEASSAPRVPVAAELQTQSHHASMPDSQHAAGATRRESAPAIAQAAATAPSAAGGLTIASTISQASATAAAAETSRVAPETSLAHAAPEIAAAAEAPRVPKMPNKKARVAAQAKDQAAEASRPRVASAQHAAKPTAPLLAHNAVRNTVATDNNGDLRDDDSLLERTMGVTDHVIAATQRAVSTIGVIPTWIGSIGNRLGG